MIEYKVKEFDNGSQEWRLNGLLHCEHGPAVIKANGDKLWYRNGNLHREDGPAVEYGNGGKEWYFDGARHREDGPACEYSNGDRHWYLKDVKLRKAEFDAKINHCETLETTIIIKGREYKLVEK